MQLSGPSIKAHRLANGLSREQVAVALDRSAQTVMLWELGRITPNAAKVAQLAELFGCHPGDFYADPVVA